MVVRGDGNDLNSTIDQHGELRFTRDAGVHAEYLVEGVSFGGRTAPPDTGDPESKQAARVDKEAVRDKHRHMWHYATARGGYAELDSRVVPLDPRAEMQKSTSKAERDRYPLWKRECDYQFRELVKHQLTDRLFWISVPLDPPDQWTAVQKTPQTIRHYKKLADDFLANFPRPKRPGENVDNLILTPVTEEQRAWWWEDDLQSGAVVRGFPDSRRGPQGALAPANPVSMMQGFLDEGAKSDLPKRGWLLKLWHSVFDETKTVLKITTSHSTEDGVREAVSYQAKIVMQHLPRNGLPFPNGAFYQLLDDLDFPVRFTLQVSSHSRESTEAWLRKTHEKLEYTMEEAEHGFAYTMWDYDKQADDLAEFDKELDNDETTNETGYTATFSVSGKSYAEVKRKAEAVVVAYVKKGIRVGYRDFDGLQADLWEETLPGSDPRGVTQQCKLTQHLRWTSEQMPCLSNKLGDPTGPIVGLVITNKRVTPYRYDPTSKASQDMSTGDIRVGDTRQGKSMGVKTDSYYNWLRGGVNVIHDPSPSREWRVWAESLARLNSGTADEVVAVDFRQKQEWLMDPLVVVPGEEGETWAQNLIIGLGGAKANSAAGRLLSQIINTDHRRQHGLKTLKLVSDYVQHTDSLDGESLAPLREIFAAWKSQAFTKCLFDDTLPPLPMATLRTLVFCVQGLEIPKDAEIEKQHIYDELTAWKIFSRQIFRYNNFLTRTVCYRSTEERALAVWDEFHEYGIGFHEGEKEADSIGRGGPKMNTSFIISTQRATDVSKALAELVPSMSVFKQKNAYAAQESLRIMGVDRHDQRGHMDFLKNASQGMCVTRDDWGRIGRVQRLMPGDPAVREASRTTPEGAAQPVGAGAA